MKPREFWDRNTILAEAFCASDERVRQARSLLDEAQAERSRTLAAFAVTVGSDVTIAALMGLNEREVRMARRTVGRGDARTVAQDLLTLGRRPQQPQQREPPAPDAAAPPRPDAHVPHPREEQPAAPLPAGAYGTPHSAPHAPTTSTTGQGPEPEPAVIWSSSMDSVLLWSWKSGLDLQTVATELGLDVRTLLLRVQVLADDGLLSPTVPPGPSPDHTRSDHARSDHPSAPPADHRRRSGRHRRHHEGAYAAFFSPTTTFPSYSPHSPHSPH
ncbi:hypothetical protein GCM10018793_02620 [Streptomyces sulfonofaciens]|uniref:Uncharacterized protein n=1 Tax=Streptomyces sulfonofaciens TaxID=68272 RepID=A0A919FPU0_9ACTN|nr:hypothetical protein [Streptomyces sulfonofaciens]GHH69723.1 hypothetical protein GCM10018793_02620 [Streptomyces sulfonofaciens]